MNLREFDGFFSKDGFVVDIINTVLGKPLGWIMYFSFSLVQNCGVMIILFTLILKIILLPFSLLVRKNSAKNVKLQPEIDKIKNLYEDDNKFREEQYELL